MYVNLHFCITEYQTSVKIGDNKKLFEMLYYYYIQVYCKPSNERLEDCNFHGWGVNDCSIRENVILNCREYTFLTYVSKQKMFPDKISLYNTIVRKGDQKGNLHFLLHPRK